MPNEHIPDRATIQRRLRQLREALGLSQPELARFFRVEPSQIWRWECDPKNPKSLQGAQDRYREFLSLLNSPELEKYAYPKPPIPGHSDGRELLYEGCRRLRSDGKERFGHMPEEYSPVWMSRLAFLDLFEALWSADKDEWEIATEVPMFHSSTPWRNSELLRLEASGAIGPFYQDLPAPLNEAVEQDVKVHGWPFVQAFLKTVAPKDTEEAMKHGTEARVDALLGTCILRSLYKPEMLEPLPSLEMARASEAETTRLLLARMQPGPEAQELGLWPASEEGEPWTSALSFTCAVLSKCRTDSGGWNSDALDWVMATLDLRKPLAVGVHEPMASTFAETRERIEQAVSRVNDIGGPGNASQA